MVNHGSALDDESLAGEQWADAIAEPSAVVDHARRLVGGRASPASCHLLTARRRSPAHLDAVVRIVGDLEGLARHPARALAGDHTHADRDLVVGLELAAAGAAAVQTVNLWVDSKGSVLLVERRRTAVEGLPGGELLLVIDLQLEAKTAPVTLGKTPFGKGFEVAKAETKE